MTSNSPSPTTIRQLQRAAYPAYALLAGIQLDLFSALAAGAKSVTELAYELSLDSEKLQVLLYVLATTGLLAVENGRFSNSPEAQRFLVKGQGDYLGEEYEAFSDRWVRLAKTSESVRTGKAVAKVDYSSMSQDELEAFYMGNHTQNQEVGQSLMSQFDFTGRQRLIDVAGGTGGLAIAITKGCPGMRATVIEQPNVTPVTQRFIDEEKVGKSVDVVSMDITRNVPDGVFDIAVMKNFIPVISKEHACQAVANVARCLSVGATLYMVDNGILDDSRLAPLGVVVNSLLFLNTFDNGGPRTEGERRQWLTDAGFVEIQRSTLAMGLGVMVAHKPA